LPEERSAPSLPIILISATLGLSAAILGFYVCYHMLRLDIRISAGVAALCLSAALGMSGAGLSTLTGSRSAISNISFSCGLIMLTFAFFGACGLVGALVATFISP